ncbi:MAG TPA: thiamine pyrophosphate-binding protein [Actinomycetales bacterium]|nr:thiamine pyrophosphate-binding protein [Actinomycetales bacterium]
MHYHQALSRAMADQGITHVFGVLGDANLFVIEHWARSGGRYTAVAHEGAGVLAASGYASTSGDVGVATITHGPALTNCVTALVDAVRAGLPVLVIAGDTDPAVRGHLQNIDHRSVVLATGAGFEPATSPETAASDLARALRRARHESRPVVLNIPITFQWQDVDYVPAPAPSVRQKRVRPDRDALEDAVGLVAGARRPVVLGGRGAAGARDQLVRLAERIGAPVATSLRGKGLFAGHPHDLGICGTLSHETALGVIGESDAVLAFGASLNDFTTAEGSLLRGKRVVHVDLEAAHPDHWSSVTVGVVGDAGEVADAMVDLLDEADVPSTGYADAAMAQALKDPRPPLRAARAGGLDLVALLRRIDEAFPSERTLVIDDGRFILTAYAELGAPHPGAYVHTCSFASIGLAMGNAIGAYAGAPTRPVLAVVGDGGFMSAGIGELNTAVRSGTDVVVVVVNDKAYGAEHVQLVGRGLDPAISTFDWPDLAPVATALGADGYTVRTMEDLESTLSALDARTRPVLIDVQIDPYDVPGSFV